MRLVCLGSFAAGFVMLIFPSKRDLGVTVMLLGGLAFIAIAAGWKGCNDAEK